MAPHADMPLMEQMIDLINMKDERSCVGLTCLRELTGAMINQLEDLLHQQRFLQLPKPR